MDGTFRSHDFILDRVLSLSCCPKYKTKKWKKTYTFSEDQTKLCPETLFFFNLKCLHVSVTLNFLNFETVHIAQLDGSLTGLMSKFFAISPSFKIVLQPQLQIFEVLTPLHCYIMWWILHSYYLSKPIMHLNSSDFPTSLINRKTEKFFFLFLGFFFFSLSAS